jgi:hypothetical protein
MFLSNVLRGIPICINAVSTLTTEEKRLRTTIRSVLIPAFRASLARVTGINFDYLNPTCLGFICQEAMELSKRPRMQTALGLNILALFASSNLGGLSNICQVLKHNCAARNGILNDTLGEDMIMISSLPKQFSRKLFQVPFGRFCSFGLELAAEAEDAAFLLFPSVFSQEVTIASDGWMIKSKVNTNYITRGIDNRSRDIDNDVEEVTPVTETQVGRADFPTNILSGMLRDRKGHLKASRYSGKGASQRLPLDPVRTLVVADRRRLRLWTTNRFEFWSRSPLLLSFLNLLRITSSVLLLPRESRFDGFSGFHTSRYHQLSRKIRVLSPQGIVGSLMQLYPVATCCLEPFIRNGIKAIRMLLHGSIQDSNLLRRWIQLYDNRSVHTKIISYIRRFVNREEVPVCGQAFLSSQSPSRGWVSRKAF